MAKKSTRKKSKSKKKPAKKQVETLTHDDAARRNIPTAEYQSVLDKQAAQPVPVAYPRPGKDAAAATADERQARDPDLDPQLVWRGKEAQDARGDLTVQAPPLFIQEKVHPKALVDDLRRQTEQAEIARQLAAGPHATEPGDIGEQIDLFADFNGIPDHDQAKTEFYQHDQHWSNRMILGDSLAVMASLAEREGLRGQVQCIYLDPPYGIKFNSNFQWSTTSRDVKDGKADHITREPEQVKAFRDTWRDGIHSYLTYLRDRLTVARDLLHDTGSIFVQIGDENVHRVRGVMDEVFGEGNFICQISYKTKKMALGTSFLGTVNDYIIWYGKDASKTKFRRLFLDRDASSDSSQYQVISFPDGFSRRLTAKEKRDSKVIDKTAKLFRTLDLHSSGRTPSCVFDFELNGEVCSPRRGKSWKTNPPGIEHLTRAGRLVKFGGSPEYKLFYDDYPVQNLMNVWEDTQGASDKTYVVQTAEKAIQRCLLMATDPGDLVLDPTCGSGTTAYVAEQWGRRWITIDTSRVSLALARARIMGARYPYYLLADTPEGHEQEHVIQTGQLGKRSPDMTGYVPPATTSGGVRQGFVYERVPHITLKSIANNAEIDVIWERFQTRLEPEREALNNALKQTWEEWEIPREAEDGWPKAAREAHTRWWEQRVLRQKEIDASIAAKADFEYLYDKPYEDKKKVRVAGPFTVESLSPHRVLAVGVDDELIDPAEALPGDSGSDFASVMLEQLRTAGVQQSHKEDKIAFTSLVPWPGKYICAEGRYEEKQSRGEVVRRAGVFIGPEFGTVTRQDLVVAAREAGDAGFDVLIACAFSYEAHASGFDKLGALPVLKARMNADLHMAEDLKNTGKGNLFVIFGEPDLEVLPPEDAPEGAKVADYDTIRVQVHGVDIFKPQTGEVESSNTDGIACWFIDTDYNEESFFVRQAYFLGANDPYKSLKTTLKAEINREAWESLHSDVSREFPKPAGGRIAVKVINHLGDEVMKVFEVE